MTAAVALVWSICPCSISILLLLKLSIFVYCFGLDLIYFVPLAIYRDTGAQDGFQEIGPSANQANVAFLIRGIPVKNIKNMSRSCLHSSELNASFLDVMGFAAILLALCALNCSPWQAAIASISMTLVSPSFKSGDMIPRQFTADGADTSPALSWAVSTSSNVKSFCLLCNDPDAPNGNWVHWVAYDIPANVDSLPEGASAVSRNLAQGVNSFGKVGWNGPAPPAGKTHRYIFTVFALDQLLGNLGRPTEQILKQRIAGHVLSAARYTGVYRR